MLLRRHFLASGLAAYAQPPAPSWVDRPMRWVQIAFVEDDPGRFDLQFWLAYFRRIHADAACLSAGGCVAFYPTKVEGHYRSKFLGSTDAFGDFTAGCRSLGMNVIARVDPHAFHLDTGTKHPDWIAVDAQGQRRKHWASPEYWVACGLGPYNFEFMTEVVREIVREYKVDGIFSNRWSGSGMCYCEHCRKNFRTATGYDLPVTGDPADPARRAYVVWRQNRLFELWSLWDREIRQLNPQAAFFPNTGGGALAEIDMARAAQLAPALFADRQARHGTIPPWANGKNGKEYRATFGMRPIAGLFSVGLEAPYRWKDSVQSAEEIRVWAVDGIAQGLRPWVIKFNAKPLDQRWLKPVEDLFAWHWRNEKYLRNTASLANVGLVYSQQSAQFYGGDQARAKVEDHILGMYHALVEARVPFEMVHDKMLAPGQLRDYRILILPNVAALSEAQCRQLRDWVHAGGSLIATHETSLYDEWGQRRKDLGLAELFGVHATGPTIARQQNAYLLFGDRRHPLVKGLEGAGRMIHGIARVEIAGSARALGSPLTTLPSYPDLPMEEVYPRVETTDIPALVTRDVGKGRVVYFPWDIDKTFWEMMHPDHGRLIANAVEWCARGGEVLAVEGQGLFDLAYWAQRDSVTVHLVNLTNPMMMRGPYRESIPVGPLTVRFRLPEGRRAKTVKLLVSGTAPQWAERGGWISVTVPRITLNEVVAADT
jgi:hypothetical protein